ncbi:hypothetical protein BH23CHL2_BH23CHL2_10240 [soil metagenome]
MTSLEPRPIKVLSPEERQQRNREEMIGAILQTAREIMREEGVGSLNLSEIARRMGITTPALYSYFPNKLAIYDALYQLAIQMFLEGDEAAWKSHSNSWDGIAVWIGTRVSLSLRYPELYLLAFGAPIPGFVPSRSNVDLTQRVYKTIVRAVTDMVEAGEIDPGVPIPRAVDLLLAVRHGIVAERIGKANVVPVESGRFQNLGEDALRMIQAAWEVSPVEASKGGSPDKKII